MAAPPEGVVHLAVDADINGSPASFGHWLLVPDAASGFPLYWSGLAQSYILQVGPALLACMHAGCSLVTCRLLVGGMPTFRWAESFSPNHGAWTGGEAQNVACGFYLQTLGGGKGSGTRTHLPATPDVFIDANVRLTQLGAGNLLAACVALNDWIASVTGPTGAQAVLGTLRTKTTAGPLPVPVFDPALAIRPTLRVETLRRRLPARGGLSPF